MRNKILSVTRNSIPYVKELRSLPPVKSVAASILMQQLDYWFEKYPDGFYKFMKPCPDHAAYREGDSWAEELAFSCDEFRTAFDSIGVRYTSKTAYNEVENKFESTSNETSQEKYYCSYHDKQRGVTWYFRNHDFVDSALDDVLAVEDVERDRTKPFPVNRQCQSTELDNAYLQNSATPISVNRQCQSTLYTEITSETTSETTTDIPVAAEGKKEDKSQPTEEELNAASSQISNVCPDVKLNLQVRNAIAQYWVNFPAALQHLKKAISERWKVNNLTGVFIKALKEGVPPEDVQPITTGWGEWANKALARKLMLYSTSEGADIRVHLTNGRSRLWSEIKSLSWEDLVHVCT